MWIDLHIRCRSGYLAEVDDDFPPYLRLSEMKRVLRMMDPDDEWILHCIPDESDEEDVLPSPPNTNSYSIRRGMYARIGTRVRTRFIRLPYNTRGHFRSKRYQMLANDYAVSELVKEAEGSLQEQLGRISTQVGVHEGYLSFEPINALTGLLHCDWARASYPRELDWNSINWHLILKYNLHRAAYALGTNYARCNYACLVEWEARDTNDGRESVGILCEDISVVDQVEWDGLGNLLVDGNIRCLEMYRRMLKYCLRIMTDDPSTIPKVARILLLRKLLRIEDDNEYVRSCNPPPVMMYVHDRLRRGEWTIADLGDENGDLLRTITALYTSYISQQAERLFK